MGGVIDFILSGKIKAEKIVQFLREEVLEEIEDEHIVLDPDRAEKLVESDIWALLWDIARGKIKVGAEIENYWFLRKRRIKLNLRQAKLLGKKLLFGEIEKWKEENENSDFLAKYLEFARTEDEYISFRRDHHQAGRLKKKTRKKIELLKKIDEFYPGCLKNYREPVQKEFPFVSSLKKAA